MGKYDFRIDRIDPTTAHGKVLSAVEPGSRVLEMGCASGYMTRFMAKRLWCSVTVVEVDREAYIQAKKYANDGVCCDIDGGKWFDEIGAGMIEDASMLFDRVLFADVLEHLKKPASALWLAGKLLKPEGKAIVSIPNICHNDIILKMLEDRFEYTRYGLLDDGHLRFWGGANVSEFFREAGFEIERTDTVLVGTGCTEQFNGVLNEAERERAAWLRRVHPMGEVFQWVYVLRRAV